MVYSKVKEVDKNLELISLLIRIEEHLHLIKIDQQNREKCVEYMNSLI